MQQMSITVIIPSYNAETTILETLKSLVSQSQAIAELIVINNNSNDKTPQIIEKYFNENVFDFKYKIINHSRTFGLAESYNEAIFESSSTLIVTLHSDVVLFKDSLEKLIKPFAGDQDYIVASSHIVLHPIEVWLKYNFWGKVYFSRMAGKESNGINGQFDCFKKSALEKIGYFDSEDYKTAGEDGDIVFRLKKIGKIADTDAKIIHLHRLDESFSYMDIIRKQMQYSEAQGVNLRRGRIVNFTGIVRAFFREILVISVFIPFVNILGTMIIILYSFLYTKQMYLKYVKDYRIIFLPFLNIFLLFVSFVYSIKGFLVGKQVR